MANECIVHTSDANTHVWIKILEDIHPHLRYIPRQRQGISL